MKIRELISLVKIGELISLESKIPWTLERGYKVQNKQRVKYSVYVFIPTNWTYLQNVAICIATTYQYTFKRHTCMCFQYIYIATGVGFEVLETKVISI